jgi:hypothetical protein
MAFLALAVLALAAASSAAASSVSAADVAGGRARASTARLSPAPLSTLPPALRAYLSSLHAAMRGSSPAPGASAQTAQDCMAYALAYERALTLASSPATRHFVDARRLVLMRRGALLVNVARGAVVDEAALFDACAAGAVDAALDVFEVEPYAPVAAGKDLRTLDNVLMTPHIGSNTAQANRSMAEAALANVRAFLAGDFQKVARVY